jgi:DNA-binding NarL/FixJ family response regulator
MEAMQLTLVQGRAPFAHRLDEAFPDVTWTLAGRSAEQLGERYDGVVVDLRPPIPADGWELVRELSRSPVLILTSADGVVDVVRSAGHLDVDLGLEADWRAAISSFCRRVRQSLDFRIRSFGAAYGLTRQERVVLSLIADDLERGEIAARLDRSLWTVDAHIKSILAKSGFHRAAAIRRALRRG